VNEPVHTLQELREAEERFRVTFENSTIGMGLLSLDGRILRANPAVCAISGYTEAELKQRRDRDNVYPEDRDLDAELARQLVAGERNAYEVEKRYVRKDGTIFWTRVNLSLVRDGNGQPHYLVGMLEDIDAQKRMLAELRESEERFRAVFDSASIGVTLMGVDRRIFSINDAAQKLVGYTADELRHMDARLLSVEADRAVGRESFEDLIAGQRNQYTMEKRYRRKDGSVFWGRVNFSAVREATGDLLYLVGMIEDITESKAAAERLAEQEAEHRRLLEQRVAERTEELRQVNQLLQVKAAQEAVASERSRLARDLHDAVTQTLFSATLIADVLPDIWEMNQAEGRRRLEELRQLTRGALAEMRTLLVELRPNALVEIPLGTLLRQLTEALIGRARLNVQLSAEGDGPLPPDVKIALYRIAQEALHNVVKHARAAQAIVTLRFGPTVRLTIADNGYGFEPGSVTGDHLGLKIMRERAEAVGAHLSVYSEPSEGTQISVTWEATP
jgi:PAS domain S-box-containing protein